MKWMRLEAWVEGNPAAGYASGLLAALPPWVFDVREWLGLASTCVGLVLALVTLAIQVRVWVRGRVTPAAAPVLLPDADPKEGPGE